MSKKKETIKEANERFSAKITNGLELQEMINRICWGNYQDEETGEYYHLSGVIWNRLQWLKESELWNKVDIDDFIEEIETLKLVELLINGIHIDNIEGDKLKEKTLFQEVSETMDYNCPFCKSDSIDVLQIEDDSKSFHCTDCEKDYTVNYEIRVTGITEDKGDCPECEGAGYYEDSYNGDNICIDCNGTGKKK